MFELNIILQVKIVLVLFYNFKERFFSMDVFCNGLRDELIRELKKTKVNIESIDEEIKTKYLMKLELLFQQSKKNSKAQDDKEEIKTSDIEDLIFDKTKIRKIPLSEVYAFENCA